MSDEPNTAEEIDNGDTKKPEEPSPDVPRLPRVIELEEIDALRAEKNIFKSEVLMRRERDVMRELAEIADTKKKHHSQLLIHLEEMSKRYGVDMQMYDFRDGKAVLSETPQLRPIPMRPRE